MNIQNILTINGKLEDQLLICKTLFQSLGEKEVFFSFSLKNLKHKRELQKYIVKPKLWERLIPVFHYFYRVKKEQLTVFFSLLSPFPNSIAIIVEEECIYRSLDACDICLFPRTQYQTDQFVALLKTFEKDKIIDGFILEEDDYEDPYSL